MIPTESFSVKKELPKIQEAWEDSFWMHLNPRPIEFFKLQVAPLLRYAVAGDILFLRTVQSVLLQRRRIEPADLYEAPFTNWGVDAVERLFTPNEVIEVLASAKRLAT